METKSKINFMNGLKMKLYKASKLFKNICLKHIFLKLSYLNPVSLYNILKASLCGPFSYAFIFVASYVCLAGVIATIFKIHYLNITKYK